MDEIIEQNTPAASIPPAAKPTWRQYLETEQATRMVYLVFGFFAIAIVMWFLQFRTDAICCGDWDGYYHIRWSSLLWENFSHFKWLPEFKWLPLTVLNAHDYNDHHFLFHLLQIPFLWFFEPVLAAKVAAVVFSTLAIFSVYWLLYRYDVDHLLVWFAAILTCANMFYYRMNMAKAPPLTIVFTIAGIYFLFERRYVWLLPLMFAFVWTYSLFPLLWIAAIIWVIIIAWNERKFEWQPLAYTTLGMVLGNVINPYFPKNLYLFWEHFITKFKIGSDFAVSVGGEWYPYTGMELLTHFPVAMIAMLIGYILFMPKNGKLPEKATFFLMFVSILLAAQFRSKRFAEYFPPFAVLFAAFSMQAFAVKQAVLLPAEFQREIEPYLDSDKTKTRDAWLRSFKQAAIWTLGIVLGVVFMINMIGLQRFGIEYGGLMGTINDNDRNDKYQQAAEWARDNIPEGERIFNANWDDFPKLFFHDTKHSYVYGLDPNYLYSENPDLYKLLTEITAGKVDIAAPDIRSRFGANYVFTDAKENDDMVAKLLDSGWSDVVYEDSEARILKLREQKGEPPSDENAPETPEEKKQLDDEEKAANVDPNTDVEEEDNAK
ncbi:MAG: hypothetical protein DMF62_11680 [Acidobacteria bacterium]|nr:MAG: hypothetical protein DMF62_11680 [Acidobacteriota bacterium]